MELLDVAFSSYAFVDNTETISSQSNQFFFKDYEKKKENFDRHRFEWACFCERGMELDYYCRAAAILPL